MLAVSTSLLFVVVIVPDELNEVGLHELELLQRNSESESYKHNGYKSFAISEINSFCSLSLHIQLRYSTEIVQRIDTDITENCVLNCRLHK